MKFQWRRKEWWVNLVNSDHWKSRLFGLHWMELVKRKRNMLLKRWFLTHWITSARFWLWTVGKSWTWLIWKKEWIYWLLRESSMFLNVENMKFQWKWLKTQSMKTMSCLLLLVKILLKQILWLMLPAVWEIWTTMVDQSWVFHSSTLLSWDWIWIISRTMLKLLSMNSCMLLVLVAVCTNTF